MGRGASGDGSRGGIAGGQVLCCTRPASPARWPTDVTSRWRRSHRSRLPRSNERRKGPRPRSRRATDTAPHLWPLITRPPGRHTTRPLPCCQMGLTLRGDAPFDCAVAQRLRRGWAIPGGARTSRRPASTVASGGDGLVPAAPALPRAADDLAVIFEGTGEAGGRVLPTVPDGEVPALEVPEVLKSEGAERSRSLT